ncbi:hypothetical protein [Qipengyuania sp.]|uniref:hypothetical protein n=1 Tax=Qipengyuania sp. TaxID=2004515 RepID=UPI003BAB94FC
MIDLASVLESRQSLSHSSKLSEIVEHFLAVFEQLANKCAKLPRFARVSAVLQRVLVAYRRA